MKNQRRQTGDLGIQPTASTATLRYYVTKLKCYTGHLLSTSYFRSYVVSNRLQQINKMTYENRNEMNKSYYWKKH